MADPNGIFLSRSDFAEIAGYVMQLRQWIAAAGECLQPQTGQGK